MNRLIWHDHGPKFERQNASFKNKKKFMIFYKWLGEN
jgi:hypothetical protein